MPQMQKQKRREWDTTRPNYAVFRRRRRIGLIVLLLLLAVLVMAVFGAYLFVFGSSQRETAQQTSTEQQQTSTPAAEQTQQDEQTVADSTAEDQGSQEEPAVPEDKTLYLTVPRLGLYHHTVRNDDSEAALDLGAVKLPETSFPWEKGDTNTYMACHRLGWPGNESYHQCLNLPSLQKGDEILLGDSEGRTYEYRVSEFLQVSPEETWVTAPVEGRQMVSLQTCIESPGDFGTLGPNWTTRFVVRADRVS